MGLLEGSRHFSAPRTMYWAHPRSRRGVDRCSALVARRHPNEPDIRDGARVLHTLGSITDRFGLLRSLSPSGLQTALFRGRRGRSLGLLRDLQDLYLMATQTRSCWTVLLQGARGLNDVELVCASEYCGGETIRALAWLETKIHQTSPQVLIVSAASREQDPPFLAALTRVLTGPLRPASIPRAIRLAIGGAAPQPTPVYGDLNLTRLSEASPSRATNLEVSQANK